MNRKKQLIALILTFVLVFSCLPTTSVLATNYTCLNNYESPLKENDIVFAGDTLTNNHIKTLNVYYCDSSEYYTVVLHDTVSPGAIYSILGADAVGLTVPAGTELANWTVKFVSYSGGSLGYGSFYLIPNWVAAAPTASLTSGSTVESGDTVTLSSASGSAVYYTTDGTTPTTASAHYDSPIAITTGVTIKAFSVLSGYPDSSVVTFTYAVSTHTVTYDMNGGNTEAIPATVSVVSGSAVSILPTAPTRSGYTFTAWNTVANGSGTAFTASTPVTADITVYAQWTVISSGDSGSSTGGSSTPTPTTPTTTTPTTTTPTTTTTITNTGTSSPSVTSTTTTEAKSDSNKKATAVVTESQVKEAVNKAVEEAVKQGEGTAAKVEIKVTAPAEAKIVETSLPKEAVMAVADSDIDTMTVVTTETTITFDKASIATISKEASADVKISASKVDVASLSETVKAAVGDRQVYNFSVTSGDKTISQFGGTVKVAVSYTPKAEEDTNAIIIYYINAKGKLEIVKDCVYNKETGMITFETNHFSMFAVGYYKVSFKDVAKDAWYSDVVSYIAARGITKGSSKGNFGPTNELTRGQLLVMVMRAYDMEPDSALMDNFADAENTYYTGYLAVAKKLGITAGIRNNMFAPNKTMTRQEMVSLLYDILKQIGKLPTGTTGKTLTDYSDSNQIANEANEAMSLFVETGIIKGSGGKLNPTGNTSKAQMAQVLYNLLTK